MHNHNSYLAGSIKKDAEQRTDRESHGALSESAKNIANGTFIFERIFLSVLFNLFTLILAFFFYFTSLMRVVGTLRCAAVIFVVVLSSKIYAMVIPGISHTVCVPFSYMALWRINDFPSECELRPPSNVAHTPLLWIKCARNVHI